MSEWRPIMNRILVQPDPNAMPLMYDGMEVEEKEGKIYKKGSVIALSADRRDVDMQNRLLEGTVYLVGPFANKERIGFELSPGDSVRYSKYDVTPVHINGVKYDVIEDRDLITVKGAN